MKPKVSIALPMWKFMGAESVSNLLALQMAFPFYGLLTTANLFVDEAREEMTREFLKTPATHMFCLDSDMGIPLYGVKRLLSHDLPIVAGLYVSRQGEHWPLVWQEMRNPEGRFLNFKVAAEWPPGALIECDATGAGCLLIKREVFESFGPPWWFRTEEPGGIDIAFCRRAREAGYKIYVDTSVECQHYTVDPLKVSDFYHWREENRDRIIDPATEVEYARSQNT